MTQNTVGCYTGWGKLKKVVVGELHPNNYFDVLPESPFKERMQKLTQESIEDLNNFKNSLRSLGVQVYELQNFFQEPGVHSNGHFSVINPRPPYTPRDNLCFIDNKMFSFFTTMQPTRFFDDFAHHDLFVELAKDGAQWHQMPKGYYDIDQEQELDYVDPERGAGENTPYLDGSNFTKCGNRIYHSMEDTANQLGIDWFKNIIGDKIELIKYKNTKLFRNHVDSIVKIIRPGLVLCNFPKQDLVESIPEMQNWDVIHLPIEKNSFRLQLNEYHKENGFNYDAEGWSQNWLAQWADDDIINTNFDLNILSLDEKTVIIPNENPQFEKLLKSHNVDVVVCKLRHRFFWGNGINCMTSEVLREDECINYFN
jgi:hypothetical protein|tara:strand:- start:1972 stop:3075 length:1104 start_codon:yes stop_codon:yes gene_type:complete